MSTGTPPHAPGTTGDERLHEAERQLHAAQRQLQLLTDTVSHDLRAPLRAIDAFALRLGDSAGPRLEERERDQLQRIRHAAARMTSLLDALSEFSRIGSTEIARGPVDLSLLAEWVLAELQEADPDAETRVHVQPGLVAHGDERLLKVMLAKLLHNAWKFSRLSGAVSIEVTGRMRGGNVEMVVRDSGTGFDPEYAHKLFEPLQRLHAAEQGGGHGLGLAIARRIAESHGGTITGDSRPGDGATFTVTLPLAGAIEGR